MLLLLVALLAPAQAQPGDLVFQTSRSAQSRAIQLATGSKYSHMGLVLMHDGALQVLEAGATVRFTPLASWIARGLPSTFVVRRLRQPLDAAALARVEAAAKPLLGLPYDRHFGWSDERMYCSELVWKILKRALEVEVGALERLGDFDLSDAEVRRHLKARYGDAVPTAEPVISPAAMFGSPLLR